ncbi:MAG: hypothetical protein ABFD08_11550 [Syntrophomonas sp.]
MRRKNLYFLLILCAFYTSLMVNYPAEWLKSLGYKQVLPIYAQLISSHSTYKVLYDPGLRNIGLSKDKVRVEALLPGDYTDYGARIDKLLDKNIDAIVECSAVDSWHTSKAGQVYLDKMRSQAYRVVVFDGGHHLPALGLAPDIIIVPQIGGYAVHSYMLDGIKTSKLKTLAEVAHSPSLIVEVPRWALVKDAKSLQILTGNIISAARYNEALPQNFQPQAQQKMSKFHGLVFAWINEDYRCNISLFEDRINRMGSGNIKKIYLAFDYACYNQQAANNFAATVAKRYNVPVEPVNQAVKVSSVFWGGHNVLP